MLVVILVLIICALTAMFYYRINWGLASVIFLLPFDRIGSFALNPSGHPVVRLVQVAGVALILAFWLRVIVKKERLHYLPATKWLLCLVVWALVPTALINYAPLWQDYISAVFILVLTYTVAELAVRKRWGLILKSLATSTTLVCLFGLWQFVGDMAGIGSHLTFIRIAYSKIIFGFPRIHATASEPLFFANFLLLPLMMSAGWFLSGIKKYQRLAIGIFILVGINLALTTSRGGILAAVFGLAALCLLLFKAGKLQLKRLAAMLGCGVIVIVITGATLAMASYKSHGNLVEAPRLLLSQSTNKLQATGSYQERKSAYTQAWNVFSTKAITGVGVGGYGYKLQNYQGNTNTRIAINNQLLEILVELGIVGLALYTGFLVASGKAAYKALMRDNNKLGIVWRASLLASALAIVIQQLTFSGFYITSIWVVFGLLAGSGLIKRHARVTS